MPKNDPVLAALGQNVRQTRETKQLTQEKLAEFASLDPIYISGIGERPIFYVLVGLSGKWMSGRILRTSFVICA